MSTLEARLERLEKLAGPADPPCATVEISRGAAAGEESRPRKRPAGHVCSDHCVSVSISFRRRVVSEGTRGDSPAPPLALPAPPDASPPPVVPEARPDSPRATGAFYGGAAGLGGGVPAVPARSQTVEMEPAAVEPAVALRLGAPTPQLGPEDVVGGPAPHGPCAIPWCGHPLEEHRCFTERLPCRYCGWPVMAHDGFEPRLPYAARRAMPCGTYLAIRFDGGEWDGCAVAGCGCPGWRRRPPYISEHEAALQFRIAEKDRIIARTEAKLARLRAECEAAERKLLLAAGPNDLGAAPRGCPVYSDEVSR